MGAMPGQGIVGAIFGGVPSSSPAQINVQPLGTSNGFGMVTAKFTGGTMQFSSSNGLPTGFKLKVTPPSGFGGSNIATSAQPLTGPSSGVSSSSLVSPSYSDYGVSFTSGSSLSGVTANICIPDTNADASTILQYWDSASSSWASASNVVVTIGSQVCGDVPVTKLVGDNVAGGDPVSVPEVPFQFGLLVMFAAGALLYVFVRSKNRSLIEGFPS